MGQNFDDYLDFQQKARGCNNMRNTVILHSIKQMTHLTRKNFKEKLGDYQNGLIFYALKQ